MNKEIDGKIGRPFKKITSMESKKNIARLIHGIII